MSARVRQRREATRQQVVDAAWELAEANGLHGLTLRDLAAAVGMRAPSLYSYFENKDAIHDAMFAEGYRALDAAVESARQTAPPTSDVVGHLTHVLTAFLEFCVASVPRYQLMFTRVVPGWEPSPEAYAVSVASYQRMAAHWTELGVTDPRDLDLVTAVTAGLAAQQLANDPDGRRWIDLTERTVRMLLTTLGLEVRA